ncbi:hypothetical protein GOP47_0030620 [Adiantum capillus-veneris]|nr:hypothetical protein GOP47_0030620 [Adiantum capillus-veneris]
MGVGNGRQAGVTLGSVRSLFAPCPVVCRDQLQGILLHLGCGGYPSSTGGLNAHSDLLVGVLLLWVFEDQSRFASGASVLFWVLVPKEGHMTVAGSVWSVAAFCSFALTLVGAWLTSNSLAFGSRHCWLALRC